MTKSGVPFGRYVIRGRLGKGGMGEVFLADQLGPMGPVRPVALKRMLPRLSTEAGVTELFLNEMATAAQLNHPHIATVYDFGEVDGVYYLAMEYVEGLSLEKIIRSQAPLSIPSSAAIAIGIAEALVHAHSRGLVHQDVSPQNVLVSLQGNVKLLDFGIARAEAAVHEKPRGKLRYAPPEQLRGAPPDRRFDLWALGVVLYEMLTGQRPFEGESPEEIVLRAESSQFRPLEELRPEAAGFASLIQRSFDPDAERRISSAERFLGELESMAKATPRTRSAELARLVSVAGGAPRVDTSPEATGTSAAVIGPLKSSTPNLPALPEAVAATMAWPPKKSRRTFALAAMGASLIGLAFVARALLGNEAPIVEPLPEPLSEPTTEPIRPDASQLASASGAPSTPDQTVEARAAREPADAGETSARRPPRRRPPSKKPPEGVDETARTTGLGPSGTEPKGMEGLGALSVRTTPWAKVELDGRIVGEGIVASRPVKPGEHRLVLRPGDAAFQAKTISVVIRSGIETKVFADFASGTVRIEPK